MSISFKTNAEHSKCGFGSTEFHIKIIFCFLSCDKMHLTFVIYVGIVTSGNIL